MSWKAASDRAGKAILLVEDDADLREAMTMVFAESGHRVSSCPDGGSALRQAAAEPPDLLLVDIDLPDMDGCEVARRLRADPHLSGARLVAMSGFAAERERDRAIEAGFDDYLIKPIPLQTLRRLLV
jgi:DNA-binding response OmpR family regulator